MGAVVADVWVWISANADAIQAICIVAGTLAAFLVIFHNGLVSRREATIQMVNMQFSDEGDKYEDFKNLVKDIETLNKDLAEFASDHQDNKDAQDIILRQLNRYELISLGIKQGVFNEDFYKRWFYSQVMRDFAKLQPFIDRTREIYSNAAYFCEFEDLARRWNRKRHPVKHPPKWKIVLWVVTGKFGRARKALSSDIETSAANTPSIGG